MLSQPESKRANSTATATRPIRLLEIETVAKGGLIDPIRFIDTVFKVDSQCVIRSKCIILLKLHKLSVSTTNEMERLQSQQRIHATRLQKIHDAATCSDIHVTVAKTIIVFGGGASFVAYALVIWAFTQAPIALVTALRETSIVFALLIGVFHLKERLSLVKVFATAVTLGGAAMLRFSR